MTDHTNGAGISATNADEITKHVVRTYEYNPSNLEKA